MRALIIGPDQKAEIAKVVDYAMEHIFSPGAGFIPGDNPEFVAHVPDGFRCVFTLTKYEGELFRHLTISVPQQGMYPSPEAAIMLAREFGFTASDDKLDLIARARDDGWLTSEGHKGENCLVLVQPTEGQSK